MKFNLMELATIKKCLYKVSNNQFATDELSIQATKLYTRMLKEGNRIDYDTLLDQYIRLAHVSQEVVRNTQLINSTPQGYVDMIKPLANVLKEIE